MFWRESRGYLNQIFYTNLEWSSHVLCNICLAVAKIEVQRKLHCVFVDLKKADDWVPGEELWHCMRKS